MYSSTDASGILLTRPGYKDHVPLHVSGRLVMLAVADLPREIRHQQGRMGQPADAIVERLRGRE